MRVRLRPSSITPNTRRPESFTPPPPRGNQYGSTNARKLHWPGGARDFPPTPEHSMRGGDYMNNRVLVVDDQQEIHTDFRRC